MSGTIEGGTKTRETIYKLYGKDFYRELGRKGGAAGTGHKFAHGKVSPREAGKIGGNKLTVAQIEARRQNAKKYWERKRAVEAYGDFQDGFGEPSFGERVKARIKGLI